MTELALHILDIASNSLDAGASQLGISIKESVSDNILQIEISDNGKGMDPETLQKISDPFYTTRKTRHVGLGIPLLKYHAAMCGGTLILNSVQNEGTVVRASFVFNHLDRQPMGKLSDIIGILLMSEIEPNISLKYTTDKGEYIFDTEEAKIILEMKSLKDSSLIRDLKEMISANLIEIGSEAT